MVAQDAVFPALRLIRYICVMVSDNGDLHVSGQFAPALHTIVCGAKGQCTFLDSVVDTDDPFMVAMLLQCMKLLGCSEDHFGVRRCKKYLTSAKVNDSWPNCSTQTCAFVDFVYHSSTPGARGVRGFGPPFVLSKMLYASSIQKNHASLYARLATTTPIVQSENKQTAAKAVKRGITELYGANAVFSTQPTIVFSAQDRLDELLTYKESVKLEREKRRKVALKASAKTK